MAEKTYKEIYNDLPKNQRLENFQKVLTALKSWPENTLMLTIQLANLNDGYHDIVIVPEIDDPNLLIIGFGVNITPVSAVLLDDYDEMTTKKLYEQVTREYEKLSNQ